MLSESYKQQLTQRYVDGEESSNHGGEYLCSYLRLIEKQSMQYLEPET